jgi:Ca2+/Na+ antiporter
MTRKSAVGTTELTPSTVIDALSLHGWTWKSCGAVVGFCGGIIASLLGLVVTAIAWFTGAEWQGVHLQRDGTILLFLTIPLLIFGAHCLDLIDKQDEKASKPRVKTEGR